MKKCALFWMVLVILAFQVGPLTQAQADVVGRLTQVEGQVDILKGGQLPANPVKVDDGVQTGDVLRTKSLSKAQITFIDNSTLTISPESRIGIEAYMFDPAQNKRNAVLQLFKGLAHVVVNKVSKAAEPDFVLKTQTAVTGVRGTDFGIRIHPNSSDILNFEGVLQVGNIFPEVSQLFQRAFKVAYSFGPEAGGPQHWVFLKNMQGTTVARGLPPTLPYGLTSQDRDMFMHQLTTLVPAGSQPFQGQESARGFGLESTGPVFSTAPVTTMAPGEQSTLTILNTVTVPPTVVPVTQTPQPSPSPSPNPGLTFSQIFTGPYQLTSVSPFTVGVFSSTGPGSGSRTGVLPGSFTASYNFSAQWVNPSSTWNPSFLGTFQATMTGQVTGIPGQVLSGTMSSTFTDSTAGQFTLSGPVTISPSGVLTSSFTGTGVTIPGSAQITVTGGTISQTPTVTQTTRLTLSPTATPQVAAVVKPVISPPVTMKVANASTTSPAVK